VLRDHGASETVRRCSGTRTGDGADRGKQEEEQHNKRPGRNHNLPAPDLPVGVVVPAPRFDAVDHIGLNMLRRSKWGGGAFWADRAEHGCYAFTIA
jgi:hypothetical protein